ncbi:hypothetical protein BKA69DRAFT_1088196 [Paraphysoderma sedebokerense]|nr:hypothetical protein BKA69DRAFT_1088058 [Paraphysoderma sedebokerense]KAI9139076.1 hypothetical protein BKA69DRAFT_1088196 [Paraphysoderma sedebokerense]
MTLQNVAYPHQSVSTSPNLESYRQISVQNQGEVNGVNDTVPSSPEVLEENRNRVQGLKEEGIKLEEEYSSPADTKVTQTRIDKTTYNSGVPKNSKDSGLQPNSVDGKRLGAIEYTHSLMEIHLRESQKQRNSCKIKNILKSIFRCSNSESSRNMVKTNTMNNANPEKSAKKDKANSCKRRNQDVEDQSPKEKYFLSIFKWRSKRPKRKSNKRGDSKTVDVQAEKSVEKNGYGKRVKSSLQMLFGVVSSSRNSIASVRQ